MKIKIKGKKETDATRNKDHVLGQRVETRFVYWGGALIIGHQVLSAFVYSVSEEVQTNFNF